MAQVTTIKFNRKARQHLDELRKKYEMPTYSAVLRKAIALLSLAAQAEREGAKMYVKTKNGEYKYIIV